MYQNCIFDLYGTLVDIHTREDSPSVWEKLALFYGYHDALYTPGELQEAYGRLVQSQEEILARDIVAYNRRRREEKAAARNAESHEGYPEIQIETVFEGLYREKGVEPDKQLTIHTGQMFRALTTEYICLYPGVKDMLERLRKSGKGVYLLSNAQKIFTEYELHMLEIVQYFDGIMISSEYGVKKPDIRFFEILLDTYCLDPRESIMIGNDALCDIEGAKQAGMDTCYIHSNISPPGDSNVNATYVQMKMDMEKVCRMLGI